MTTLVSGWEWKAQLQLSRMSVCVQEDHHQEYLKIMLSRSNGYSMMPVVGARALKISCSVGR